MKSPTLSNSAFARLWQTDNHNQFHPKFFTCYIMRQSFEPPPLPLTSVYPKLTEDNHCVFTIFQFPGYHWRHLLSQHWWTCRGIYGEMMGDSHCGLHILRFSQFLIICVFLNTVLTSLHKNSLANLSQKF